MKRTVIPELLDSDAGTPSEISTSLSDLNRINRWFGGVATTRSLVEQVARKLGTKSLSLLEVAAGTGAVPAAVAAALAQNGAQIDVTLLDRASTHLNNGHVRAVSGDALALPFSDGSFDLVSSTLFVHHLAPEVVVRFVNEGLRVCRAAVLVNDLIRHPAHLGLVYAGMPLYRSRLTRHDAPASVRQAYTVNEMEEMVRRSKAARVEITRHYLFRMGVIAWKNAATQ
ncbi:MAG: methyltransferase domain-containing protein [Terriglobales bacterium]|jgi:ubiquinone/menaquinone biosynthesis C-methylase UbiE